MDQDEIVTGANRRAASPGPAPAEGGRLSDRMATVARDLETQQDPAATYRMATELALSNIEGCHAASLSMVRGRGAEVVSFAATDRAAARADELQARLGEGPCLDTIDAVDEVSSTYSPDLAHDERYPVWGPRVVEEIGMHSVLSFRLFTHEDDLGALNLYSRDEAGFDRADQHDGSVIAAHVAIAFATAQRIHNLGQALTTRTVIGQATGVIMERYQVDADVAFAILARLSSQEERKVRDLAALIVSTGDIPS